MFKTKVLLLLLSALCVASLAAPAKHRFKKQISFTLNDNDAGGDDADWEEEFEAWKSDRKNRRAARSIERRGVSGCSANFGKKPANDFGCACSTISTVKSMTGCKEAQCVRNIVVKFSESLTGNEDAFEDQCKDIADEKKKFTCYYGANAAVNLYKEEGKTFDYQREVFNAGARAPSSCKSLKSACGY